MHPRACFADLDRPHDVRVLNALAVTRFTKKPSDRGAVLAQLLAQHLHGNSSVGGVLGLEDRRRAAFADFVLQGVAGDDLADEVLARHAANLMAPSGRGKRRSMFVAFHADDT